MIRCPGIGGLKSTPADSACPASTSPAWPGFGCCAVDVDITEDLQRTFKAALTADTATVIVMATQPQKAML
ncbi:hypothetical protein AQJ23_00360 [Streptomyces antibioticus]|nr:hypothetical protein [Streptomyces antibioticus]KUN29280.1 hypothetical protein AQJ23_00360 [Streptomyces antibioticus]